MYCVGSVPNKNDPDDGTRLTVLRVARIAICPHLPGSHVEDDFLGTRGGTNMVVTIWRSSRSGQENQNCARCTVTAGEPGDPSRPTLSDQKFIATKAW